MGLMHRLRSASGGVRVHSHWDERAIVPGRLLFFYFFFYCIIIIQYKEIIQKN